MHAYAGAYLGWLVLAHVLSAFFFVLLHGPSVYAMWQLRRERDPARAGALLDLSSAATGGSWTAIGALATTGLAVAALEHTWRLAWVWGSGAVLFVLTLSMSMLAARPFNHARSAAGLKWFDGKRIREPTGVVDAPALGRALDTIARRAPVVMALGVTGLALLVWLMVARPT